MIRATVFSLLAAGAAWWAWADVLRGPDESEDAPSSQPLPDGGAEPDAVVPPISTDIPLEEADAVTAFAQASTRLRTDPLTPEAMRLLALACVLDDPVCATRRFSLAERISRRDGPTQVWLMRLASERGDYRAFVRHISLATRVRPQAAAPAARAFAGLLADPDFRAAVEHVGGSNWRAALVDAGASNPQLLPFAAQMFDPGSVDDDQRRLQINSKLAAAFLTNGDAKAAVRQLAALDRRLPDAVMTFAPTPATVDPRLGPFAWSGLKAAPLSSAALDPLELTLEPGRRGALLQRTTVLEPGQYTLQFSVHPREDFALPGLTWRMRCSPPNAVSKPWSQPIPAVRRKTTFSVKVTMRDCTAQLWELSGVAAEDQRPSSVRIGDISLIQKFASAADRP